MRNIIFMMIAMMSMVSIVDTSAQTAPQKAKFAQKNIAFKSGERLDYDLYFNWRFIWTKAGKAHLYTTDTIFDGKPALKVDLLSTGSKSADFFFKMRDTVMTVITPDLLPRYYRKGSREGGRYQVDEAWYSYPGDSCKVYQRRTRPGTSYLKQNTTTMNVCIQDMVSSLMRCRSLDVDTLVMNQKILIPIVSGKSVDMQTLIYRGRRLFEAKNGKTYNCLLLSFVEYTKEGEEKEVITFYITDDENHIPVRLDLFLNFGSAKAFLTQIRGNRNPLTSVVGRVRQK